MGLDSPLIHSCRSHQAWPTKAGRGSANTNPAAAARDCNRVSSSLVAALSAASSPAEKNVSRLQSDPLNSNGYPATTTRAYGACARIAAYRPTSRAGNWVRRITSASLIALLQFPHQLGLAHSVSTGAKFTSLPPTVTVTKSVPAVTAGSWPDTTSATLAPEQARNSRARPAAAATVAGY